MTAVPDATANDHPAQASLLDLARSRFGELSQAEGDLLQAAEAGTDLQAAQNEPAPLDLADPSTWPAHRTVRAALLRWLFVTEAARERMDPKGFEVFRAHVTGRLDLELVQSSLPLAIHESAIPDGMSLRYAGFPYVDLRGSLVGAIGGVRLTCAGSILLDELRSNGGLDLRGARIGGNVSCDGAHLASRDSSALDLSQADIGSGLLMRNGFRADGAVQIHGTRIAGNVVADGVLVGPASGPALRIETSAIGGSLFLRRGFRALGQVRIYECSIRGSIECDGGRFTARKDFALLIEGSAVGGAVLLRQDRDGRPGRRFRAIGGVRLYNSSIASNLDVGGAEVRAHARLALDARDTKVGNSVFLGNGLRVRGMTDLSGATIERHLICDGGVFVGLRGDPSLLLEGVKIGGALLMRNGFRAVGQVRVYAGSIGSGIEGDGGRFAARRQNALLLEGVKVGGAVLLRRARPGRSTRIFRAIGGVRLYATSVEGNLDLDGAIVSAFGGRALDGRGVRISGSVLIRDGARVRGTTDFSRASINSEFSCEGSVFIGSRGADALALEDARIGGAVFMRRGFRAVGRVYLLGGSIGASFDCDGGRFAARGGFGLQVEGVKVGHALLLRRDLGPGARAFRAIGGVRLFGTSIEGNLSMDGAILFGRRNCALDASGLKVGGSAQFIRGFRAAGSMHLPRASIGSHLDLRQASLDCPGRVALHLGGARVGGSALLRDGLQVRGEIDLRDASISRLEDDTQAWPDGGGLKLDGLIYNIIDPLDADTRLRWLQLQDQPTRTPQAAAARRTFLPQPYEQLIQTMRRTGHDRDARKVAIAKEDALRRSGALSGRAALLHAFYGWTMRYGYQPQWSLIYAPVFLVGLMLAFYAGASSLMVPAKDAARVEWMKNNPLPPNYPSFDPIAYSVDAFVPILSLQQKENWIADDRATCGPGSQQCGYWLRVYLWLHTVFGWIITTLAVAGFTGLVRKS